jgi:hypothetical protein
MPLTKVDDGVLEEIDAYGTGRVLRRLAARPNQFAMQWDQSCISLIRSFPARRRCSFRPVCNSWQRWRLGVRLANVIPQVLGDVRPFRVEDQGKGSDPGLSTLTVAEKRVPFLDAYRTMCVAPSLDFLQILEGISAPSGGCLIIQSRAADGRSQR